ncbi:Holliday junction resolvase RuvX [Aquisalimonas asiatica]|uniref:Putative pre-16S rRNA nuclease n=1 Tax=Aquisalimonas asiatica TaxID=406100 RepID=A0A1H8TQ23_9GAMM|nr:Holliday junction resolvase RuvX [Aquisalimonas asiatica]SEO92916.1 putative holliday junction resolvase [Aquisalimonas asiatica]
MTGATLLGFDYGRRRIGVAVGETITGAARPLVTLDCPTEGRPDWERIEALIREWQPTAVVVGRPEHADGTGNAVTQGAERFARQLQGRFGLTVHLVDERLSSRAAEERLAETGKRRRHGRGPDPAVDSMAACIILETWLADQSP